MSHWLWVPALALVSVLFSFSTTAGWRRRRRWFRRGRGTHAPYTPGRLDHPHGAELPEESAQALRFPLSGCRLGESVCLQCLEVDHCVLHRLRELGLTPGVELSVVQDSGGPLLVSVRGSRVALGRDLADNLYVIPADRIRVLSPDPATENQK